MSDKKAFCPGCPRRGVFMALGKLNLPAFGDLECSIVGARPPISKARPQVAPHARPAASDLKVAIIEDTNLLDPDATLLKQIARDGGDSVSVVLDNGPAGKFGERRLADIVALCRGLGIERVRTVDPFDIEEMTEVLQEEADTDGPSVMVAKAPCAANFGVKKPAYEVDSDRCKGCEHCLKAECSAMKVVTRSDGNKVIEIDPVECTGCGICMQLCKHDAIFAPSQMQ